jgi:hypothetical protein
LVSIRCIFVVASWFERLLGALSLASLLSCMHVNLKSVHIWIV